MTSDTDKAIAEFLAKGGVIQQAAYRQSGRVEGELSNPWGSRKPGRPVKTAEVPTILEEDDEDMLTDTEIENGS
jgi:hypothetical protein